jgi:NAD(P)-dependent dehydrogenase (short-subunit alcohol dehydrogenase family)
MRVSSPTVVVTGASRGLGAATARLVAQLGANVILMARSQDKLETVVHEIEDEGGLALAVPGNVSRAEDCQRVIQRATERFGGIDGLVNNAGILEPVGPIAEAEAKAWRENWAVNVLGPVLMCQAALPHLRARKGRVVNVSSGAAVNAIEGWGAYCLSKAALNHLTRMLAAEEPEVTAISLRPGVVDTEMQEAIRRQGAQGMPEGVYARFVRYHEEGELLPPEVPGSALAVLALYAPHEWSGAFMPWDHDQVQSLVRRYAWSASG